MPDLGMYQVILIHSLNAVVKVLNVMTLLFTSIETCFFLLNQFLLRKAFSSFMKLKHASGGRHQGKLRHTLVKTKIELDQILTVQRYPLGIMTDCVSPGAAGQTGPVVIHIKVYGKLMFLSINRSGGKFLTTLLLNNVSSPSKTLTVC